MARSKKRRRGIEKKQNAKEEIIKWLTPKLNFLFGDLKKFADQKNWKGIANTITRAYIKDKGASDGTCNLLMNSLHTKDLWEKVQAVHSGEIGTSGLYKHTRGPPKDPGAAGTGNRGKNLTKKQTKALGLGGPPCRQDNSYLQKLERENAEMKRMIGYNMAAGGTMGGKGGMGMDGRGVWEMGGSSGGVGMGGRGVWEMGGSSRGIGSMGMDGSRRGMGMDGSGGGIGMGGRGVWEMGGSSRGMGMGGSSGGMGMGGSSGGMGMGGSSGGMGMDGRGVWEMCGSSGGMGMGGSSGGMGMGGSSGGMGMDGTGGWGMGGSGGWGY